MEEVNIAIKKRIFSKKVKIVFLSVSSCLILILSGIFVIKFCYLNKHKVKNNSIQLEQSGDNQQNTPKSHNVNNIANVENSHQLQANLSEEKEQTFTGSIFIKNESRKGSGNKNNKKKSNKNKKIKVKIVTKEGDVIKVFADKNEITDIAEQNKIIKEFEKQNNIKIIKDSVDKNMQQADEILDNLRNHLEKNSYTSNDNSADDFSSGYDKLVEKLASSVVHIKVTSLTDADDLGRYKLLQALNGEVFPAKKVKIQATCSGFFVTQDGYIATNHHCIDDAQNVDVETKNGNKYNAKIIGYFEGADLAILKIEPKDNEKFNAVKIANSDNVSVGDNIVVIGGPLGYKWSASAGIISGKSRALDNVGGDDGTKKHAWGTAGEYIQVDAAINGGNSGGPAFNIKGEVVGIAAAGYTFLQGMKFIISSNTLSKNLEQLKNGKIIQKGLWGISINELEPYDIKAIGMEKNTGMLIHEVIPQSPADKAGLKRGDVILSVNGKELKDKVIMKAINSEIFDGSVSEMEINRYGKIKKFKIKAVSVKEIEKLEKGEIGIQDWSDENVSYRLLTSSMHKRFRFPKDISGIIVTDIKNNDDPLLMIAVGDIIMGVNDTKINSIEEYKQVLSKLRKEKKDMAIFHIYKPTRMEVIVKGSKIG